MDKREFSFDTQQLMRIALILWMAYFFVLGLLDWALVSRESDVILYYAIQAFNGFIILVLTWLPWKRLERAILPVSLALMTILPTLTVHIMMGLTPNKALFSPEGMTLRLTPILLMGLLLTAWTHKLKHVVIFSLGTAMMNLIGIWIPKGGKPLSLLAHPSRPHYESILVTVIQMLSLLIVGYFTSALNSRLRAQKRALEEANAKLRDQASIREELTISQERNRMARELHDTLAHTLSGLSVQLQTVKAYWEVDPATSQEMLDGALAATRSGLQETRRALKALRATPLEDLGLSLAIRELAESVAERGNLELRLSITEALPPLTAEVSQCLYRVAQEAITNVLYHANAKRLSVEVSVNGDGIQLTVEDDGVGFDVNGQYAGHWGIQGMRERAQLVGGRLLIKSQRDQGTTIELHIAENII